MEPLIRIDEKARLRNYSTIRMTPESIVRTYRAAKARREPVERAFIFSPKRPRIPWHQKISWDFLIGAGCCGLLGAIGMWMVIWVLIPFVRMLRWN